MKNLCIPVFIFPQEIAGQARNEKPHPGPPQKGREPLTFDRVPLTLKGCDSERCSQEIQRLSTAPLGGARTCLSEASPAAQCLELIFLLHRSVQHGLSCFILSAETERMKRKKFYLAATYL